MPPPLFCPRSSEDYAIAKLPWFGVVGKLLRGLLWLPTTLLSVRNLYLPFKKKEMETMLKQFCGVLKAFSVLAFLFCWVVPALAAAETTKAPVKMDLGKTLEFFQGVEARETFPEAVTFAYNTAYSLLVLQGSIAPESSKKIEKFIAACQREGGGFVMEPKFSQNANVIFTYHALRALHLLGAIEAIDAKKAIGYVLSLVDQNGGIRPQVSGDSPATLASTAYGVLALNFLGAVDKLDAKKTAAFIEGCREKGKGYGMMPKGGSSIQGTNLAVQALEALGMLPQQARGEVVAYLKTTRYSGLIEEGAFTTLPTIKAMSEVLETMALLGALDQVNRAKVLGFVESLYVEANGGFGPRPGLGTTPPSTYHAIFCLVKMGKIPAFEVKKKPAGGEVLVPKTGVRSAK